MASGSAEHPWRRGHRSHVDQDDYDDEPEQGEVDDTGTHSETDTEEYYNRCSTLSDETISADDHDGGETASSAAANATSSVARGWGGTGRRGFTGSATAKAAAVSPSPSSEPEQPMAAIVAAAVPEVVVLHPMPLAFKTPNNPSLVPMASVVTASLSGHSGGGGGVQPANGDAMEVLVAGVVNAIANDPPTQAVVHQQHPTSSSLAPPAAGGEEHAVVVHHAPPAAAGTGQQIPKVYTCKRCGVTFTNPQALGGHVVGHRNRDLAAAAAAAAAGMPMSPADGGGVVPGGRRGAPKPAERLHVCNECGAEFLTGVQLGGHKRKHWTGAPIVPKKKKTRVVVHLQPLLPPPAEAVGDVTLAMSVKEDNAALPAVEATPPTVERTPELAHRPPPAGRVLLFGIDIGTGKKTPEAAQHDSPAETQTSPSSNGEQ